MGLDVHSHWRELMGCGIDGEYCREEELEKELKVLEAQLGKIRTLLDWKPDADAASDDRIWEHGYEYAIQQLRRILLPPKGAGNE